MILVPRLVEVDFELRMIVVETYRGAVLSISTPNLPYVVWIGDRFFTLAPHDCLSSAILCVAIAAVSGVISGIRRF
jgi:hypothetical protein